MAGTQLAGIVVHFLNMEKCSLYLYRIFMSCWGGWGQLDIVGSLSLLLFFVPDNLCSNFMYMQ